MVLSGAALFLEVAPQLTPPHAQQALECVLPGTHLRVGTVAGHVGDDVAFDLSNTPVASLRATGPGCDCFSIPILSFIKPKSLVWAAFVFCKITLVSHSWLGFFLQSVVDYVTFCHVRVVEKCLKNMLMY